MKRSICLLVCLGLLFGLAGCARTSVQKTVFAMDTVMELQLWGADAEEGCSLLSSLLEELDSTWSVADDSSVIGRINRGEDVSLTSEQAALFEQAETLSRRTKGAFDPKLLSVSRAWGFYTDDLHIPTEEEITAALSESKWDLGAALKGYAGDRAVEILAEADITHAILNLGGNVQTYGQKPDGTPWQIGIQDPRGSDHIGVLSVVGTAAVVTSGDYQRYFEADGVRYHHIIDPETGAPAASGLMSVTVVCKSGLTADALSTALFVMGLEEATAFWRQSNDFEAVFITTDGMIYATEGAALSGCQYEVITVEN